MTLTGMISNRPDQRPVTRPAPTPPTPPSLPTVPLIDVVIPVYNESADLAKSVRRLHEYLSASVPYPFVITIADNASTDDTLAIAQLLAAELPSVSVIHLAQKGRGRALSTAWAASPATVLAYMDVDLSTDLDALLPLVAPLLSGHSDIAIGTRLHRGARVRRGAKREVISRSYNLLLRGTLRARFSDAQCGFKAVRAEVAQQLLPLIKDTGWFFDTEMLVLAERSGLRIYEVPVDWVDDPDSRVNIVETAMADLRGIVRVGRALATRSLPLAAVAAQLGRAPLDAGPSDVPAGFTRQLVRFGAVGIVSTVAYVVLYLALRPLTDSQVANLVALGLTAVLNTTVNRRLTFGATGRGTFARHQLQGFGVFLIGLGITSGSLQLLHQWGPHATRNTEVLVLVLANLAATVVRFVLLRSWVFRSPRSPAARRSSAVPTMSKDA